MIVIVLPDIPTEYDLLAQASRGDQDALRQIYVAYFTPIYQFIRIRVGDAQSAEDLASEVFLDFVAVVKGRNPGPRQNLRGWLFRVARNKIYDHYGKDRQYPTTTLEEWIPDTSDENPEAQFVRTLNVERARDAMQQLAPEQQEVLILRFGQMLNLQETADIMGKSVSAVKSLQFRAVERLRQILSEMETAHG
jgi:RNA polymerase sigma-70 factor (ECF subfamily)